VNGAGATAADSSWLLWSVGAAVAWLAAHSALGWVQLGQRATTVGSRWAAIGVAAAILGTGMCSASVLSLASAALRFAPGYLGWAVPALWAIAVAASVPLAWGPVYIERWWAWAGAGSVLGVLATALDAGWIMAAGFRPPVDWQLDIAAAAAVLMIAGCAVGVWLRSPALGLRHRHRGPQRLGAATVIALTLMIGQDLMMVAASVTAKTSSAYRQHVPGTVLSLFCGVLVPLALGVAAIDLALRRQTRRGVPSAEESRRRHHRRTHSL
jgi:hypothetical protein